MIRALLAVAVIALAVASATGCSTVIRPTKPDAPLLAMGEPLAGVRFDGEETVLREPGMPLSPSRSWQREVSNYTATSLNTILGTKEEAPAAHTVVSFDLASPSVIQIGTWKEMTITLTTTLPDGTVVKSQPVIANIDDPVEYALMTSATVGGTVLNATGTVAIILFFFTSNQTGGYNTTLGAVAIGALIGGILLSVGQSVGQYFVASNEEKRWSNLYSKALMIHAADVRKGALAPKKPPPATPPPAIPVKAGPPDPSDAPPPLLETPPKKSPP